MVRPHQVESKRSGVTLGHDFAGATHDVLNHLVDAGSQSPAVILPALQHTFIGEIADATEGWTHKSSDIKMQLRMSNGVDLTELVSELVASGSDSLFCAAADAPTTLAAIRQAGKHLVRTS